MYYKTNQQTIKRKRKRKRKMNTEMIEQNECPICMDKIEGNKNKLVTECGHCFHTSCLLKNAAHNGFGCPYCRTTLAEDPEDSDEEEEEDDDDDEDEEDEETQDLYSNNVLSGMRWLFQRASGEDIDADPAENSWQENAEPTPPTPTPYPSIASIVERLGVYNMDVETLVKYIVEKEYSEYYTCDENHQYEIEEMFEDIIFSPPAPAPPTTALVAIEEIPSPIQTPPLAQTPLAPLTPLEQTPTETPLRKTLNSALKIMHRMSTAIAIFK